MVPHPPMQSGLDSERNYSIWLCYLHNLEVMIPTMCCYLQHLVVVASTMWCCLHHVVVVNHTTSCYLQHIALVICKGVHSNSVVLFTAFGGGSFCFQRLALVMSTMCCCLQQLVVVNSTMFCDLHNLVVVASATCGHLQHLVAVWNQAAGLSPPPHGASPQRSMALI